MEAYRQALNNVKNLGEKIKAATERSKVATALSNEANAREEAAHSGKNREAARVAYNNRIRLGEAAIKASNNVIRLYGNYSKSVNRATALKEALKKRPSNGNVPEGKIPRLNNMATRKRKPLSNFTEWTARKDGRVSFGHRVTNKNGNEVKNQQLKKAFLEQKGITTNGKRIKINVSAAAVNPPLTRALGFNTQKKANAAFEKIKKTVAIIPGMGNDRATGVLRAALDSSLRHFANPAVRQAHSGSILETTAFAVGAMESDINVVYFDDSPLKNNIINVTNLPRTFILKSSFSLNNTIKVDDSLKEVWLRVIGLAANKSSVARNPTNMLLWTESSTSPYKGFSDVEPDVLEWIPPSEKYPRGRINIYELKVGEGKGETQPAEAYQLIKAKRAIEILFERAGATVPSFRLYFLPWMYGTPANKSTKFKNYKTFPGHGVNTWANLSKVDKSGYNITELSQESFKTLTDVSPAVITATLDLLRNQEARQLMNILAHIHRHSIGYKTTTNNTLQRMSKTLRQRKRAPARLLPQFSNMQNQVARIGPRRKLEPGQDDLASYILSLPNNKINAKASDIVSRAFKRLAARPESKFAVSVNGRVLGPSNFGFTRNNNYISNAEGSGIRNSKEMQRIRAGLAKPGVLNVTTRLVLAGVNFKEKSAREAYNRNAAAILNRANLNSTPTTQFEALYKTFLNTHGRNAITAMNQLIQSKKNSAMNNNTKSYYNGLATRARGVNKKV